MGRIIQYVLAIILISIGAAMVLGNVGIIDFNIENAWLYIYPMLFIIIGLKWMTDRIRHRGGSWVFGSFFFIFGSLLMANRFGIISFHFDDIFKLWPLLIIYVGFSFIGRTKGYKRTFKHYRGKKEGDLGFFSVGEYEYSQPNWKVEPMNLRNMAGDFYLDFSKAFIPEEKIPIMINSLAADVHIIMPGNVAYQIEALVKAGDIDVAGQKKDGINRAMTYKTADYDTSVQKLDLFIKLKAGSIKVVEV
ncbi:hypothetical protein GCM10007063_13480 [Lentibacillus kapialis]|uniref:Lia operon protein LiaF n=1 Tax=Lentibacillus kapialis TaxID=340214 RepID=A0A917PUS8_9BACI|nr:cell wall-active antibiotics response protein LiaF [Lentibacillus kapialis]GGJ92165.1 hypothetical protein GCM10007063_13480 [Lentibacillus kapialis]